MIRERRLLKLLYLLLVVACEYMGLAVIIVTAPHLMLSANTPFEWSSSFDAKTFFGIYLAIQPLGQLFGAAFFGKLSDAIGRKKTLLMTLGLSSIAYVGTVISIAYASFAFLILTRLLAGLCAGNVAIAQATATDLVTAENEKSHYMSILQGSIGISWVIGTLIAGGLSEVYWFKDAIILPMIFAAALFFATFLITFLFKDIKTPKETQVRFSFWHILKDPVVALVAGKYRKFLIMWFAFVLGWWLSEGMLPAFLFVKFNLTNPEIGNFLAYMGILFAIFQFFFVQRIAKKMHASTMAKYAALTGIAVLALIFVGKVPYLYLIITLYVLSIAIAIPGMITTISDKAGEHQGQIMGVVSSIQALAIIIAMSLGGLFISANINSVFVIGGLLFIISIFMLPKRLVG